MASKGEILQQLVEMSRRLGDERKGLVILGEGNTSARVSEDTFYVKASGTQLGNITEEGFVEVNAPKVLAMLDGPALTDEEIKANLAEAMVEPGALMPSIETVFHAYVLALPGVGFVGHTHPVSVNAILCSKGWKDVIQGRICPDEIVCCGAAPACCEYIDPGIPLARGLRQTVKQYVDQHQARPKAVLIQNHGLIAIGATPQEVESITLMWDKTAKILAGTFQFGGPNYLTDENVSRIHTRPDEGQRKKLIEGR